MDVLQADGSIRWSSAHRGRFTAERTGAEVASAVAQRQGRTLQIDEAAVAASIACWRCCTNAACGSS